MKPLALCACIDHSFYRRLGSGLYCLNPYSSRTQDTCQCTAALCLWDNHHQGQPQATQARFTNHRLPLRTSSRHSRWTDNYPETAINHDLAPSSPPELDRQKLCARARTHQLTCCSPVLLTAVRGGKRDRPLLRAHDIEYPITVLAYSTFLSLHGRTNTQSRLSNFHVTSIY